MRFPLTSKGKPKINGKKFARFVGLFSTKYKKKESPPLSLSHTRCVS